MYNYDIDKLMNIPGLGQNKALEIVRYVIDGSREKFIKTQQAQSLYEDIIKRMLKFTNTDYATNRILLLSPTTNYEKISQLNDLITSTLDETKDLDYDYIKSLYEDIQPLEKEVRSKFNDVYAIVCEDYDDYLRLLEQNVNKYCNIYSIEDHATLTEYEFIVYLYNEYNIEPGEASNIVTVSNDSQIHEVQPNIVLDYFRYNRKTLENVFSLREYLGMESCINEIFDVLDDLKIANNKDTEEIIEVVEEIKQEADEKISLEIKNTNLTGSEVLELLDNEGELPPKIKDIINGILEDLLDKFYERTSLEFNPFITSYPLKIDYDEIRRIVNNKNQSIQLDLYEKEVNAASRLAEYKQKVIDETLEVIHYDYPFSLACFSRYYDLTIAEFGDKYVLEDSLHLDLKGQQKQEDMKVDTINYWLDDDNRIVLLTGANSGGKTTLLELLAQHTIMAHMGIGVCSRKAQLVKTSELYYFTKMQSLNAGAFETFLKSFIPVTIGDKRKLVLIDELESITELEASIKIIIGFIEHLIDKNSYAVIVTHMAPEILKRTGDIKIRTDGIQASGLDEDYNLIVDRTPKINYLANSTPELILRRVYEKSEEPAKSVYKDILDKF